MTDIRELARYGVPVVKAMQLSGDGKRLFLATTSGVMVYEAESMKLLSHIDVLINQQASLQLQRDQRFLQVSRVGERFALLTNKDVQVYQIDDGLLLSVPILGSTYSRMAFSPDGRSIFVHNCSDWDACRQEIRTLPGGQRDSLPDDIDGRFFMFSPGGAYFVSWNVSSDYSQWGTIWRTSEWNQLGRITLPPNSTLAGFSPDGSLYAIWRTDGVSLYQTIDGKLSRTLPNSQALVINFAFSPDGSKLAYNKNEDTVWAWDLTNGDLLSELKIPTESLISLENGGEISTYQAPLTGQQPAFPVRFDTKLMYSSNDDGVMVSGVDTVCSIQFDKMPDCIQTEHDWLKAIRERGDYFVTSTQGEVYIVRHQQDSNAIEIYGGGNHEKLIQTIRYQAGCFPIVVFDIRKILVCHNSLWDLGSGQLLPLAAGETAYATLSPDGRFIARFIMELSGQRLTGTRLVIEDLVDDRPLFNRSVNAEVRFLGETLTFTSNGKLLIYTEVSDNRYAGSSDVMLILFDLSIGMVGTTYQYNSLPQVETRHGFGRMVTALEASSGNDLLGIGFNDGLIFLVDLTDGSLAHSWQAHVDEINSLAFSSDGRLLASAGSDGFIKVWGGWR